MTWQMVEHVLAGVGAISLTFSAGVVLVGLLLTKNADALNRHSSHRLKRRTPRCSEHRGVRPTTDLWRTSR